MIDDDDDAEEDKEDGDDKQPVRSTRCVESEPCKS